MSRFESLEQARASVDPGDVVVAGGMVYRVVSWEGDEFRADRVALEDHVEWSPWTAIEAYHHRDDADIDELLQEHDDVDPHDGREADDHIETESGRNQEGL
jgi:hypothetical protein